QFCLHRHTDRGNWVPGPRTAKEPVRIWDEGRFGRFYRIPAICGHCRDDIGIGQLSGYVQIVTLTNWHINKFSNYSSSFGRSKKFPSSSKCFRNSSSSSL